MVHELEADDVRMLVEIGFMALSAGLTAQAQAIFAGVKAARPAQEAGPLGLALTAMAQGDLPAAVAILRTLPPSDAALTYLGLALARSGEREEARRLLGEVLETAADPSFAELAGGALAEL